MFNVFENNSYDDDINTIFKDAIMLILMGILVIFIIVLIHINPTGKNDAKSIEQPGRMSIELHWADDLDVDVDLWVKHETEPNAVGYSNKDSKTLNLVRDDLGLVYETAPINYENIFARSLIPGEYIINVHLYNLKKASLPFDVTVYVRIDMGDLSTTTNKITRTISKTIEINTIGQETTAVRFVIDDKGMLIPSSINSVFTPIRGTNSNIRPVQQFNSPNTFP